MALAEQPQIPPELLIKVYETCTEFATDLIGNSKCEDFLKKSYATILPYFPNLAAFSVENPSEFKITLDNLTEKELLAFAVWIEQFFREIKNFLVGVGRLDIGEITRKMKMELKEIGFYDYYQQARELKY